MRRRHHYVCFSCRYATKGSGTCPHCGKAMVISAIFDEIPPKQDARAWAHMERRWLSWCERYPKHQDAPDKPVMPRVLPRGPGKKKDAWLAEFDVWARLDAVGVFGVAYLDLERSKLQATEVRTVHREGYAFRYYWRPAVERLVEQAKVHVVERALGARQ